MTDNRRIAKNTILLYLRMVVLMAVKLYTSRVILQVLGVEDFGVYNIVGGMVVMFGIFTNSMSTAIGRYLTFELGRKDENNLKKIFSTSVNVQLIIGTIVLTLGLAIGWFFLHYWLNIPNTRYGSAEWVLACSFITFAINLLSVPYSASIIAHEDMGVFAYISILEAFLNLSIVFTLFISPFDKLKSYALLLVLVSLLIRYIYVRYCLRKYQECKYQFILDKNKLYEMFGFAGWNTLVNGSWIFNTQGLNILINVFFGVTLNAARGIATQVESVANQFIYNFMTALNPQITKSYAAGDMQNVQMLVCRGARFSFFLMMVLAIPICLEVDTILRLWLTVVPGYAPLFVRLTFLASVTTVLGNTLVTALMATGEMRNYSIVMTVIGVWVFPLTWIAYALGSGPEWCYIIYFAIYVLLIFVRIFLVSKKIGLTIGRYLNNVLLKCLFTGILSMLPALVAHCCLKPGILRLIIIILISVLSCSVFVYKIGADDAERQLMGQFVLNKLRFNVSSTKIIKRL